MSRAWLAGALSFMALGCRSYDFYDPITSQRGLVPASQFARYGSEQAEAVQIGRSLGQWHGTASLQDRAVMVSKAADYARTLPGVVSVVPDTQGYRLTVTFKSGWRAFVLPISDGGKP